MNLEGSADVEAKLLSLVAKQGSDADHEQPSSILVADIMEDDEDTESFLSGGDNCDRRYSKPANSIMYRAIQHLTTTMLCAALIAGAGFGILTFVQSKVEKDQKTMEPQVAKPDDYIPIRQVSINEVSQHNFPEDCWIVYYNSVYDMTEYANDHPGGHAIIVEGCGRNGTIQYELFHDEAELVLVNHHLIGMANNTIDQQPVGGDLQPLRNVTMIELAQHDTPDDCWVAFYATVYDLTDYATIHPGGAATLTNLAGTDGTDTYEMFHNESLLDTVLEYRVGTLITNGEEATSQPSMSFPPSSLPSSLPSETQTPTQSPSLKPSCGSHETLFPSTDHPSSLFPNFNHVNCGQEREYCTDGFDCCESLDCFHVAGLKHGLCLPPSLICFDLGEECISASDCCDPDAICFYWSYDAKAGLCGKTATRMPSSSPSIENEKPVATQPTTAAPANSLLATDSPTILPTGDESPAFWPIASPITIDTMYPTTVSPTANSEPFSPSLKPTLVIPTKVPISSAPTRWPPFSSAPITVGSPPSPLPTTSAPTGEPTASSTVSPTQSPTTEPTVASTIEPTTEPNCSVTRISLEEIQKHNTPEDCWMALHGLVFDLTEYAPTHPGGARIVTNNAGTDASTMYDLFHTEELLVLVDSSLIGVLEESSKDPCT